MQIHVQDQDFNVVYVYANGICCFRFVAKIEPKREIRINMLTERSKNIAQISSSNENGICICICNARNKANTNQYLLNFSRL